MNSTLIKYHWFLLFLIVICYSYPVKATIRFEQLSLEKALEKASIEKKQVFIDTYATWCAPCKIMDKVFEEEEVGKYFNDNFINIKIDMDGPQGEHMLKQYGVVWLPTLLILDQTGAVINKIDKLLTGDELIATVSNTNSQSAAPIVSQLSRSPFPSGSNSAGTQDYNPQSKAEVIYIYDEQASSGRPHIMYHEAYLHLQLMDGKHQAVVKKYLSTQQNWSTDKNIKFIFDFIQDVHSKQFDFFISNKSRFEEVVGKENVANSLAFLISQRIEKGFPKVTLPEIIHLYSLQFEDKVEERAYKVYLNKLLTDDLHLEYIPVAKKYLEEINPNDDMVAYQLVTLRLNATDFITTLDQDLARMLHAVSINDTNPEYFYTLARIYYHRSEKTLALKSISKSLDLASKRNLNVEKIKLLEESVLAL